MAGAGAAGIAVAKLLLVAGARDIVLCDQYGSIYEGRTENMNWAMEEMAKVTNRDKVKGDLSAAIRGALDVRARNINVRMKIAASEAIAAFVGAKDLKPDYIIPHALNFKVPPQVAAAVARAAMETGEARVQVCPEEVAAQTLEYLYEGHMRYLKETVETTR
ncbi:MAG: NAD-dependent malic enzyme 4 [Deltaproteobacteria bacterium CSP1-8]|nr:MAG: NAD-dependent malic enzyme 4 [Deltaproteobacteria bacterium CSP1-8]